MRRSLFIGRWQPFHDGHRALIDFVLAEGKPVLIAIRDTPISQSNPYSVQQRAEMIRATYPDEALVAIMMIPDISEIVYGREVGYGIREIRLAPSVEAISGTAIRREAKTE